MKQIYILFSLATISYFSFGQSPELVKDINTQHSGGGAPSELVNYNGYIYFVKDDGTNGAEIWRTDGTTTEMYTDIDNSIHGDPIKIIHHADILFFITENTFWYSEDINTTVDLFSADMVDIVSGDNVIYVETETSLFVVALGTYNYEEVYTFSTSIADREFTKNGDDIFFIDETEDEGKEVVYVDITIGGGMITSPSHTILDKLITGTVSSDPANLTSFNGKCYWVALKDNSNGNGTGPKALMESDGTLVGTTEFFAYDPTLQGEMYNITTKNTDIEAFGSSLYYYNMTGNPYGGNVLKSLYGYNGTTTLTLLDEVSVTGLIYGFNRITFYGVIDGRLCFYVPNYGTYSADGSTITLQIPSLSGNQLAHINKMVQLGSELLYSKLNDDENLYKSDLSGNESTVYTFTSGFSEDRPKELTILGSEVFFIGYDDLDGIQIWKTDGTNPNTSKVTTSSFPATRGSFPTNFFELSNRIYFTATSDLGSGTSDLYKTDGTEGNTIEVINSNPNFVYEGGVVFDNAYFFNATPNILKKFDGTTVSTIKTLEAGASQLTVSGSNLFFTSTSAGEGTELWVSDGTELGTEALDLFDGASFSSSPEQLVDVDGVLYFTAVDSNEGTRGLWKSDGTLGTTEVVFSDIIGDVHEFTAIGENIFFTVDDLFIGEELKVYNTVSEEVTKIDLVEGDGDAFPENLTEFNGYLYLTYQLSYNTQSLIKLDPADFSYSILNYMNVTQLGGNYYDGVVTTSSFLSFYVTDYTTDYGKRVTVSKNDQVSYAIDSNLNWQNAVVVDDMVYYGSGTLYESDGLSSKEIGPISGGKIGYNDFLYFSYEDDDLDFEPHKYASTRQGFDLNSSMDIEFDQDGSSLGVSWTSGSGNGRLIIASSGSYLKLGDIVDGEVYPSDPMFGNGLTSLAAGESYFSSHLVASGDVSEVTVTDLAPGSTYYFTIIEYEEIGIDDFKYDLQGAVTSSFQMEKLEQEILFENPGVTLATETVALDATCDSDLDISYLVTAGPAYISGSVLYFSGEGEVTLTLNQSGNAIYDPAEEVVVVFDVVKADQVVTFDLPDNATYLDDPISFSASTDAPLSLEYGISGPGLLSVSNDAVTITGAGSIEVTVFNDGNSIYNAISITETIAVAKADHTITVNEIEDIPYGSTVTFSYGTDPNYEINTTAAGTGLIAINILNGPAEVSETNAQQLTITGVGTVEFEVTNEGNDNFNAAATAQGSFEAVKADQSISVNGNLPTEISFDEGTYSFDGQFNTLSGDVSYVIIDGPGFFSGDDMDIYNIAETGEVTISAWAPSSEFYNGSPATELTFTVIKGDQEIIFEGVTGVDNVLNMVYDPAGYEFNATARSGLDVSFEVITNGNNASFDDNLLTVTEVGQFQITMSQDGNENYNAATDEVITIAIQAADQTISYEEIPNKLKTDDPFEINAESSAGLELSYTITQGSNITLDGNEVTINSDAPAGSVTIQISADGNSVYNSALPISLSFCISPVAPTLTLDNNIISSDNTVDQHEWYKDGVFLQVSDNSNNTFTPSESGTYTAVAQGGTCSSSDFSNEIVYEEVTLGLEDMIGLILYPVPTSNFLNVSMDNRQNRKFTFEIVDATGRSLMNGPLKKQIDVSGLKIGTFYLRLIEKTTESITVIPFIKE